MRSPSVFDTYHKAQEKFEEDTRGDWHTVGDVAYFDEEGFYYICDRKKDMIISGGVNIYPAEIEAALDQHPDVLDVAVIGIPSEEWGESVHAVIVKRPDVTLAEVDILAYAREHLAGYKMPRSRLVRRRDPAQRLGQDPEEGAARAVLGRESEQGLAPPRERRSVRGSSCASTCIGGPAGERGDPDRARALARAQCPLFSRPMSMNVRIFPREVSGRPLAFQNSIRFPVPVCTFTMMSPTMRRSFDLLDAFPRLDPRAAGRLRVAGLPVLAVAVVVPDDLPQLLLAVVRDAVERLVGLLVDVDVLVVVRVVLVLRIEADDPRVAHLPAVARVREAVRAEVVRLGVGVGELLRVHRRDHALLAEALPVVLRRNAVEAAQVVDREVGALHGVGALRGRDAAHAAQVGTYTQVSSFFACSSGPSASL